MNQLTVINIPFQSPILFLVHQSQADIGFFSRDMDPDAMLVWCVCPFGFEFVSDWRKNSFDTLNLTELEPALNMVLQCFT